MNDINYLLFLFIFLISVYNVSLSEIKIIPDANLNATAAFVSLENLEKTDFLYFSFDFNYHNQVPQKIKDVAFFKVTSELKFGYTDFRYIFLEKKQEDINSKDLVLDIQRDNLFWKYAFIIKEKVDNEYNYYIQIKRIIETKSKNTLILRLSVAKKEGQEGQITVENLFSFPDEIAKKMNTINSLNFGSNIIPNYDKSKTILIDNDKNYYHNEYHHDYGNKNNYYKNDVMHPNYNGNHFHNQINIVRPHKHYRYMHNFRIVLMFLGMILLNIWIIIFILYFLVNKRKKEQLAIIIGNMQQ